MAEIPFNVEISKVLDLLCSQIYDSPMSLLRENVQNAYDAVLQRLHQDPSFRSPEIRIDINGDTLTISDNGIGMDNEGLKAHYWTAGSSGKNNPEARAAGVVGTFGVGAMANFGVCTELHVETRLIGTEETWNSGVRKDELSLSKECIYLNRSAEMREDYGTTVRVVISSGFKLTKENALEYLTPYVKFLQVPVFVNDHMISKHSYDLTHTGNSMDSGPLHYKDPYFEFDYQVVINNSTPVLPQCKITNIKYIRIPIPGDVCLKASESVLFGLRNSFGLASIAVNSSFHLNGIVNLLNLVPTAGREALSRESTAFVSELMRRADNLVAQQIARYPIANNSRELHAFIRANRRYDLADYIEIPIGKTDESLRLKDVRAVLDGKRVYYFKGNDKATIDSLKDKSNLILTFSNDYNRANIQQHVLSQKGIPEMKDDVRVSRIYDDLELSPEEASILLRTRMVIEDDYSLSDFRLAFADISHNLAISVQKDNKYVNIYLSRTSSEWEYLKSVYKNEYTVFEQFIKDMVRSRLYPRFSSYLPSATKEGADALYAYLQKKQELFTIENTDLGEFGDAMKEYLNGKKSMRQVIEAARNNRQKQKQELDAQSIGSVADVLGHAHISTIKDSPRIQVVDSNMPMPPIMRLDKKIPFKVLKTDYPEPDLNNIRLFLSLSDRLYRDYVEFFYQPHTTNVIWSMHKIIYFFTHASNNMTLYYELDLDKSLGAGAKGAKSMPTTTIITKDKIFIPIVDEMDDYFNVKSGVLKFMVKYDSVKNHDKEL